MSIYRQRFEELYQFFAGYFHQDWSHTFDWKNDLPNFAPVVRHFKATNPKPYILKVRNQLEDLLQYDLDESELQKALSELGSNYFPKQNSETYRNWLKMILEILNDPTEKGKVLTEIEKK